MQAWILDESPGAYRWGSIDLPQLAADDVADPGRGQRAEPHGPVGHPGHAEAAAAARARLRCRRRRQGGRIGGHHASPSATRWSSIPGVSPVADIVAWGNDSPMGPGFMIYGEHCWGGHAETAIAPGAQRAQAARSRARGRSARRSRSRTSPRTACCAGPGCSPATRCWSSASAPACRARRWRLGTMMGARVEVTSRSEAEAGRRRSTMGAAAAHDSAAPKWPVQADVVVESVGPATWEQSVRSLKPGGRLVVCGSTAGPKVELNLPRLFFKQFEIIGSTMGSYQEFAEVLALVDDGSADHDRPARIPLEEYDEALARLEHGEQLGKIVLTHEGS